LRVAECCDHGPGRHTAVVVMAASITSVAESAKRPNNAVDPLAILTGWSERHHTQIKGARNRFDRYSR